MHPLILGAALGLLSSAAGAAGRSSPACPGPQAAVQEHLFSAACADCWAQALAVPATPAWRFDWIVPAGDAAPLAAAGLADAADRARRIGAVSPDPAIRPAPDRAPDPAPEPSPTQVRGRPTLPALRGLVMTMESGPAWQGYFGVQLTLRSTVPAPLPAGASAWLALVEQIAAGSDGTPVARSLVRSVAGPLPLDSLKPGQATTFLRALRWPAGAEPTRLQARAWIESPTGQMLAVAADQCR